MNILLIEKTDATPYILMNKKDGIFEISGRSLPEDAVGFYNSIVEWVAEYAKDPNPTTDFTVKLEYFNTSTSKVLLKILNQLSEIKGANVIWYSLEDDEEMVEVGKEYSQDIKIPFEFREY
jgi:hypothetical protein